MPMEGNKMDSLAEDMAQLIQECSSDSKALPSASYCSTPCSR
jgi:hypothetical protein